MSFTIDLAPPKENKLLLRRELEFSLTHIKDATPKKQEVTTKIASMLKADAKNVIVYDIKSQFGSHVSKGKAKVYSSMDQLKKVERPFVVARKTGERIKKTSRRMRKDARKKKAKMFGTLKRNLKKAEKRKK